MAKTGRPSEFSKRLAGALIALAKEGKTDEEIAKAAGISVRTIHRWKQVHPDFCHFLQDAKDLADDAMESSLFESGIAGNVTAQIFWLKNRQPERWRDVNRVEVDAKVTAVGALPSPKEALEILSKDFAMLPAEPVVVPELEAEATTINDPGK